MTEAAAADAEKAAAESCTLTMQEEAADEARHEALARKLRRELSRRLKEVEAEESAKYDDSKVSGAASVATASVASSASAGTLSADMRRGAAVSLLQQRLRNRRAADVEKLAAARRKAAAELTMISQEADRRSAQMLADEQELAMLKDRIQAANVEAAAAHISADAAANTYTAALDRLEGYDSESLVCKAAERLREERESHWCSQLAKCSEAVKDFRFASLRLASPRVKLALVNRYRFAFLRGTQVSSGCR